MSDAVEALRALALASAEKLHPQEMILDDDLRAEMAEASNAVSILQAKIAEMRLEGNLPATKPHEPLSLADEPEQAPAQSDIERMLDKAVEVVESVQQEALERGVVMVLQFRRLPPAEYQVILDKTNREHKNKDSSDFMAALRLTLLEKCYVRAETTAGEDLALSYSELFDDTMLTHGDRQALGDHCIAINRAVAAIPFRRGSSGQRATS